MKIVCIADQHQHFPEIPECDLLINAGDVSFAPFGALAQKDAFLAGPFAEWMGTVHAKDALLVAGNHDQSIQAWGPPANLDCDYLEDDGAVYDGLKVWGTPWQPWFGGWAFNAPQRGGEAFLDRKFSAIPDDTDVIVCHGPPYGYGDLTRHGSYVGSHALSRAIDRVKPRLVVCGHIHPAYGVYDLGDTIVVNAALVNEEYELTKEPIIVDL